MALDDAVANCKHVLLLMVLYLVCCSAPCETDISVVRFQQYCVFDVLFISLPSMRKNWHHFSVVVMIQKVAILDRVSHQYPFKQKTKKSPSILTMCYSTSAYQQYMHPNMHMKIRLSSQIHYIRI